jgi:phosphoglucosamine mutase
MRKLFGTDGIRGTTSKDLTSDLVRDVGCALAVGIARGDLGDASAKPRVVIGRDTRISGPDLEEAFVDGFTSGGGDVLLAGIVPTAGVAYLTASMGTDAGVVISASHNPPDDNGIKIFGPGGWKLPVTTERAIEALVGGDGASSVRGSVESVPDATDDYIGHLVSSVDADVSGIRLVADCANGAACAVAPEAFRRLGVESDALHCEGNGRIINEGCGALHPEVVCAEAKQRAEIGLTFDGDADRVLISDESGRLVDGDAIVALLAKYFDADTIAVTVMANQALREWCAEEGIRIVETPVGDRHVLEAMREQGLRLGGEQSGHIIALDHTTTGDGILTGLKVLDLVASHGRRLADIVPFEPFPQVLTNVRGDHAKDALDSHALRDAIAQAEAKLGPHGRVLVRPSGTEPLVRVMVEASDATVAEELADFIAEVIRKETV